MDSFPSSVPYQHRLFMETAVDALRGDDRIVGVAAGGSLLTNAMDEFSDLDLVVAVEPAHWDGVLADRQRIGESLGPLLCAFTGEHVGEPRLLICLYAGHPPLHVDLKFLALPDARARVEDPLILWERDRRLSQALQGEPAAFPAPDLQWIEDRFWIWIHYAVAKVGRGELFEALDFIAGRHPVPRRRRVRIVLAKQSKVEQRLIASASVEKMATGW